MFLWITEPLSSKSRIVSQLDSLGKPGFVRPSHRYFASLLLTKPTLTLANLLTNAVMGYGVFMEWMKEALRKQKNKIKNNDREKKTRLSGW